MTNLKFRLRDHGTFLIDPYTDFISERGKLCGSH